jgi:hypothetical protein
VANSQQFKRSYSGDQLIPESTSATAASVADANGSAKPREDKFVHPNANGQHNGQTNGHANGSMNGTSYHNTSHGSSNSINTSHGSSNSLSSGDRSPPSDPRVISKPAGNGNGIHASEIVFSSVRGTKSTRSHSDQLDLPNGLSHSTSGTGLNNSIPEDDDDIKGTVEILGLDLLHLNCIPDMLDDISFSDESSMSESYANDSLEIAKDMFKRRTQKISSNDSFANDSIEINKKLYIKKSGVIKDTVPVRILTPLQVKDLGNAAMPADVATMKPVRISNCAA